MQLYLKAVSFKFNISYVLLTFHPNTEVIVLNLSNEATLAMTVNTTAELSIKWWYCVLDNFNRNNCKGLQLNK